VTPDTVLAHLAAVLDEVVPGADLGRVDPRARFREELDLDSMDFLRMVQGLHARTGVDVPEADYGQVTTLDDLVAYVARRAA
jgi:acyl carrier protein